MLTRLQDKLPEKQVGLVPADAFFIREVALPAGMEASDREAFLQLDLEAGSPFPIEQLCWGYIAAEEASTACVYATPRSRLRSLGFDQLEQWHHLFPGFVSILGEPVEKACVRFVAQQGVVTALRLQPGHAVPQAVTSRRVRGEIVDEGALLETRDRLAASLAGAEVPLEPGLWLGAGVGIGQQGEALFRHHRLLPGEGESQHLCQLPVDESRAWEFDLRDAVFAATEKTVRRRSGLIWKSLRVAGWTTLVLLLLQLGSFALAGWNQLRAVEISRLEPQATRVENKLTLAGRLNQSTEEDLRPFLLLESINPIRPDSIFFEKVRVRAFNELEIEGKSTEGVTPVNSYADTIAQLPFVADVENNSQTRNNQTSFEIVISFAEMPPPPASGFDQPNPAEPSSAADDNS